MSVCLNLSTARSENPIGGGEAGMYEADKQRRNYNEWFCNFHLKCLLLRTYKQYCPYVAIRQLGDLGVLRGVIRGFSEEVKTRGFPSPSLGGFGFFFVLL